MTTFIALYRGDTVAGARLVALTADARLVQDFAAKLVADEQEPDEGQRAGLRLIGGKDDENEKG